MENNRAETDRQLRAIHEEERGIDERALTLEAWGLLPIGAGAVLQAVALLLS